MAVEEQQEVIEVEELEEQVADEGQQNEEELEDIVTIGEETPPQQESKEAPEWVKDLRKKNREDQKRIKELEKQLGAQNNGENEPVKALKKPTLEECDYDNGVYEKKLEEFYDNKREIEEQQKTVEKSWNQKLEGYANKKTELKVRDFDDAEDIVKDTLNETQQGIIIQGATNPALVVYALGKNEQKAKELAQITDPIQFAFEVAKLETQMKVTKRTPSTSPESTVIGDKSIGGGSHEKNLEKLRVKARKSGDFSEVLAYKRKHKLN